MVRVVLLVNANGDAVGRVCNLGNGVDDKSVVLFAVVRGNNIQTVADVEQSGEVVFVRGVGVLSHIVLAKLVGKRFKLSGALVVKS